MASQLLIKLFLISGVVLTVAFALRSSSSTNLALRRLGGLLFVAVSAVSILWPSIVTWMANKLGVGRGTDLVLYALVVAFLFVSVALYQRIHELESRLARLTRAQALASGLAPSDPEGIDAGDNPDRRPDARKAS